MHEHVPGPLRQNTAVLLWALTSRKVSSWKDTPSFSPGRTPWTPKHYLYPTVFHRETGVWQRPSLPQLPTVDRPRDNAM